LLGLAAVLVMPAVLPVLVIPAGLVVAVVVVRVRGESLVSVASRHLGYRARARRGRTSFRARQDLALPAPLSSLTIRSGAAAAVLDPARRTLTGVVPVEAQGLEFADPEAVEQWAAAWGRWLAHLGYVPDLSHVAVTVFTRPVRAARSLQGDDPVSVMVQQAAELQQPEHEARTVISVTVELSGDGEERALQRLSEAVGSLRALEQCGLTVLPPLDEPALVGWVRSCFDPVLSGQDTTGAWPDARPTALEEGWASCRHDGAVSVAFAWDECPGDSVSPHAVGRLLGPAPYPKRVTMVFAPVPAQDAAREVDRQAEAAVFRSQYRRRLGRDETARERLDVERARQTAQEQARGSGLLDVGVFAVVSVPDGDDPEAAAADVHNRAGQARLRLRRAHGGQADAFAATLGLGFLPPRGW
jgi:hypothetical protein